MDRDLTLCYPTDRVLSLLPRSRTAGKVEMVAVLGQGLDDLPSDDWSILWIPVQEEAYSGSKRKWYML